MTNFFDTPGSRISLTAEEWYLEYEDLIVWEWWEEISPLETLYMGYDYEGESEGELVAIHKLTFTSLEKENVIVENLGLHKSPESVFEASGIGHFHTVAKVIYEYFDRDD